jgi:hypothetical protein
MNSNPVNTSNVLQSYLNTVLILFSSKGQIYSDFYIAIYDLRISNTHVFVGLIGLK